MSTDTFTLDAERVAEAARIEIVSFAARFVNRVADEAGLEIDSEIDLGYRNRLGETLCLVVPALITTAGELPFKPKNTEREPITMDSLFGDDSPTEISESEVIVALQAFESIHGEDFSDDEQELYEFILKLKNHVNSRMTAVREGYTDDFLNSQLEGSNLPDWLNDNIDWELVYEKVCRAADEVEGPEHTYYVLAD